MKAEGKGQALSTFFTYDYQAELIHDAQMLNPGYEGALIGYWEIFTAHLIKCFEADRLNESSTKLYNNVKYILDTVKSDGDQGKIVMDGKTQGVSLITEMFMLIGAAYHSWTTCDLGEAIRIIDNILNVKINMSEIPGFSLPAGCFLYRGRTSETQLDKADMFHIPFMQAYKIRNQRFSITGQPILYLTDSISGVFNELAIHTRDEYEKLHIVQYRLNPNEGKCFDEIFDMTINADFEKISKPDEFKYYFCKFLLSCACSFPNARGRDKSFFVEEYVIPQLVTQLLSKRFKGVRYNTINSNWSDESGNFKKDYINYAFFTKQNVADNAIDIELRRKFIIDSPITVLKLETYRPNKNYSLNEIVDVLDGHFDRINRLRIILDQIGENDYYPNFKEEKYNFFKNGKYRYAVFQTGDIR